MFSSFFQFWKTHRWKQENAEHQGWMLKGGGSRDQDQICPLSLLEGQGGEWCLPWKLLQATWDFFWASFHFLSESPSPILACKSFPPHPTQSPTFYPKLFNQLKLSCVFLEGFPLQHCQNVSIFLECVLSFPKLWASHSHNSDFKYTLTFSFQPNILLLPQLHQSFLKPVVLLQASLCLWLGVNICPFQSHPMWLCLCFRSRRVITSGWVSTSQSKRDIWGKQLVSPCRRVFFGCLTTDCLNSPFTSIASSHKWYFHWH